MAQRFIKKDVSAASLRNSARAGMIDQVMLSPPTSKASALSRCKVRSQRC